MKQVSLSALRQDVIISRQVEAVIVICINHIREAVHHIAVHHIAINRLAVLLRVVRATLVQAVVTVMNPILQTSHHIVVAQRKAQRQRRVHMVLCQDLVQVKMRNFSHFNPPEAQPQCVFFHTIVRIHLVTYSYNGYEFVSYCRKLPNIRKSSGMPACNREF